MIMRPLLGLCLIAAGCALNMDNVKAALSSRASSDLSCKPASVEFEEIKQTLSAPRVRAKGCGKSQEYELVQSQWKPAANTTETKQAF
jgi:hypothetical protein